jgi:hypothetical protein
MAGARPPKHGTNPGQEFAKAERLHNVVIGAGFKCKYLVVFATSRADNYNANAGHPGANPTAGFNSSHARHIDVKEHEVGRRPLEYSERGLAAGGLLNGKTNRPERGLEYPAHGWLVIHD